MSIPSELISTHFVLYVQRFERKNACDKFRWELMTAWWLPDDWRTTGWKLAENWVTTAWLLPANLEEAITTQICIQVCLLLQNSFEPILFGTRRGLREKTRVTSSVENKWEWNSLINEACFQILMHNACCLCHSDFKWIKPTINRFISVHLFSK